MVSVYSEFKDLTKMKIKPIGKVIYLKLDTVESVGGKNVSLDTSSKKTTREFAEVVAIGPAVTQVKVGDKIFVKAWAIDIINHDKQEYFFTNEDANGLCAVVSGSKLIWQKRPRQLR